ncbi:MAG: hypothetical protein PUP93_33260 [Rhizonema sp. NSF051]|nr:hypothetical protein [Rhizonema sp. NSF051]
MGVPHPEVDCLEVNGNAVEFLLHSSRWRYN